MAADSFQKNNPLHGIKLETIVTELVEYFDWDTLGKLIPINCFLNEPSIRSTLKFLRRTPCASQNVDQLYQEYFDKIIKNAH